jgi:hypothetical protein
MKIERENIEREKTHFNRGDVCWMRKQEKKANNEECWKPEMYTSR